MPEPKPRKGHQSDAELAGQARIYTAMLRALAEQSEYAIYLLDPDGRVRSWNVGAERILGWRTDEVLGHHLSMFHPPEAVAAGHPQLELDLAAKDGRHESEGLRLRKDANLVQAETAITALRDASGTLSGFTVVTRDLTERRHTERALHKSEEQFRLMVGAVKDYAIFVLDEHGNVESWNEGAARIKGYTAEEIVGKHFSVFYAPGDIARGHPEELLRLATEDGRFEEEGWRVRKDGSRFWASITITAVRAPSGRLVGFTKVTRDMTERKEYEDRLRQSATDLQRRTRLLEEANQELNAFTATVSHDLRAPLRGIERFATQLMDQEGEHLSEPGRRQLGRIQEASQRMSRMIEDLLRFSRAAEGSLTCRRVDVSELAEEVAAELAGNQRPNAHTVEFHCAPGIVLFADPPLLRAVLANLLENAWKFTREVKKATVAIEATSCEGMPGFRVTDNGVGFEPQLAERVFRPFERLRADYEGMGIGLATVHRIVDRHGGRVWAEGRPGHGTALSVCLPDGPEDAPASPPSSRTG